MVGLRVAFIGSASLSPHNYRLRRSAQGRRPSVAGLNHFKQDRILSLRAAAEAA
jgi:hypothetical protein